MKHLVTAFLWPLVAIFPAMLMGLVGMLGGQWLSSLLTFVTLYGVMYAFVDTTLRENGHDTYSYIATGILLHMGIATVLKAPFQTLDTGDIVYAGAMILAIAHGALLKEKLENTYNSRQAELNKALDQVLEKGDQPSTPSA